MMISKKSTIKELTFENRYLEPVIERFGLKKFHWDSSLEEVCLDHNQDPDFVVKMLYAFDDTESFPKEELSKFPITYIIEYLKKTHLYYLNKKLPEIELSISNLRLQFSEEFPELDISENFFKEYKNDLTHHIENEEKELFPYIELLYNIRENIIARPAADFFKTYSILEFIDGHHEVEDHLEDIRKDILSYSPECPLLPFKIFLNQLNAFEKDLCKHAQVENEVLIPKALELENQIKAIYHF